MGTVHELFLFNNYPRLGHVRAGFMLTVEYGEDISHVLQVITEVAACDERILTAPPFEVFVIDLCENGVRLLVLPTAAPADYWAVRNDLR